MFTMINTVKSSVEKHIRYRRTVNALRALPNQTAWDLDLFQGDAERLARRAVYGA